MSSVKELCKTVKIFFNGEAIIAIAWQAGKSIIYYYCINNYDLTLVLLIFILNSSYCTASRR